MNTKKAWKQMPPNDRERLLKSIGWADLVTYRWKRLPKKVKRRIKKVKTQSEQLVENVRPPKQAKKAKGATSHAS